MGVSKFDKSAAHKRYETRYAGLTTGKQVRLLLRDIHALRIRAEQGDFAAVDVLADLTTAVTRAGLTARQWEAVENVYLRDMTQEDAGRAMGVSRQSMYEYLERAEEKISEIYYYWAGHGEGYSGGEDGEIGGAIRRTRRRLRFRFAYNGWSCGTTGQ